LLDLKSKTSFRFWNYSRVGRSGAKSVISLAGWKGKGWFYWNSREIVAVSGVAERS